MELTNVNVQPINSYHFYQGASFRFEGREYSANIAIDGVSRGPSSLYAFGAHGDDCITTHRVEDPELLDCIEQLVQRHNNAL